MRGSACCLSCRAASHRQQEARHHTMPCMPRGTAPSCTALRLLPRPPQLLACLRVTVATVEELRQVEAQLVAGPLAGPLGAENETQALRTLEAEVAMKQEALVISRAETKAARDRALEIGERHAVCLLGRRGHQYRCKDLRCANGWACAGAGCRRVLALHSC